MVTGRKADVMLAAHNAAEAALRLVKPGNEVVIYCICSVLIWQQKSVRCYAEAVPAADH